ncbi:MAG: ATP-binding protein [Chitinophagaceae bacterium]
MRIWNNYIKSIELNCASPVTATRGIDYWRNNLFASTIIYLLPFCMIALIPSLWWIITSGQYLLGVVDIITLGSMIALAFIPRILINTRKIIFIACVYVFCCIMLYNVGLQGPGLIFLLTACILCTLIFPARYAWGAAILNTIICILFALAIIFRLLPLPETPENTIGIWIAISSNLVFLSFLSAALIPRIFNGLQQTIQKEKQLQGQLGQEQQLLRQAMGMLEQKNSELEQFAYAASHDLQEPLRMVTSFLTLLENKYKSGIDEKGKKYIHFAVDGARRMHQLILDLLAFSRAGHTEEQLENVDLNELVQEIQILFRRQIEEKNASICPGQLPIIPAYSSPLKQVFQNLVSNALKYGKEGVPLLIKISVHETGTEWQFSISDNGIGISGEYFDKIFVIFQRLHTKEEYSGTGIGLAICKKIVDSMGGRIWLESEEGKGSTFYFTILK